MDDEFRQKLRQAFREGYFLEASRAGLRGLNPDSAPPTWVDEELREALDVIDGPWERKKRTTVLRLAEAEAMGIGVQQVFKSEDCCSSPSWYGRPSEGKPGWKDDLKISHAYDLAKKRAMWHYDRIEEERLAMRRRVLARTEDRLTEISTVAAEVLFDIMLDDEVHGDVRRKAAVDVLTHAAPETAPKAQQEQHINMAIDTSGPSMRDIRNRNRRLPHRVVGDGEGVEEAVAVAVIDGEGGPPPPPSGGLRIPSAAKKLYSAPPELGPSNGNGSDHGDDDEDVGD